MRTTFRLMSKSRVPAAFVLLLASIQLGVVAEERTGVPDIETIVQGVGHRENLLKSAKGYFTFIRYIGEHEVKRWTKAADEQENEAKRKGYAPPTMWPPPDANLTLTMIFWVRDGVKWRYDSRKFVPKPEDIKRGEPGPGVGYYTSAYDGQRFLEYTWGDVYASIYEDSSKSSNWDMTMLSDIMIRWPGGPWTRAMAELETPKIVIVRGVTGESCYKVNGRKKLRDVDLALTFWILPEKGYAVEKLVDVGLNKDGSRIWESIFTAYDFKQHSKELWLPARTKHERHQYPHSKRTWISTFVLIVDTLEVNKAVDPSLFEIESSIPLGVSLRDTRTNSAKFVGGPFLSHIQKALTEGPPPLESAPPVESK